MKKKIFGVLALAVISVCVFSVILVHTLWYSSPEEEALLSSNIVKSLTATATPVSALTPTLTLAPTQSNSPTIENFPLQLIIPALNIDAKIQDVGITKKGNMGVPNNFTDVGWYKYGAIPGRLGSAVIAGHVNNGLAFPAVFAHLGDLKKGDDVYIKMDDGKEVHFVVVDLSTYDYNAKVSKVFNQNDDRYLKLITCTGVFVKSYGTHNKRLVVTAVEA